jgi:hypothetical protein
MSRREDIVSCIDVTIMDRSAHSALPSPYSKVFPAFGAGAAVTRAAVLGGKRFTNFIKPHACVSALVLQHGSERTPPRIEHRLGLSGLSQSGGIHVADEDGTVGLHQTGAQFMQEIFSPIRDLGMNRSGSVSMAGALGAGQHGFQVAVKALRLDRRQSLISERGKSRQPQIDSQTRDRAIEDRTHGRFISLIPQLHARHTDIQIPASAAVFTEITRTQFEAGETIAVPQRQPPSREVDLSASIANRSDLEGNPAKRAACAAALAPPGQPDFSMLTAPPRVFFRDLLHRLDGQVQGTVTARDTFEKRPEIKSRQESSLASRTGHPYSIPKRHPITPRQTSRKASPGMHAPLRVSLSPAGLKARVSRGEIG